MKSVLPLVTTKIGLATLTVMVTITGVATVASVQAVHHRLQIAQAEQRAELTKKFYSLIIAGTSKITTLETSVKSLTYNQYFRETIIKSAGVASYQQMLQASQKAVHKNTEAVKQAQQALDKFVAENQDFMPSLRQDVQQQVIPIITLNIPSQIREWQAEQHQLHRQWQCSPFTEDPICF